MLNLITEIPFGLPGKIYRSAMPYGLYDREGSIFPAYQEAKISTVVVLAESEEIIEKSGRDLLTFYPQQGMGFLHLPIKDFSTPDPFVFRQTVEQVLELVRQGKNIAVHCSGGIGRTGMFAACMAKRVFNIPGEQAIAWVRNYVPGAVETDSQWRFVIEF